MKSILNIFYFSTVLFLQNCIAQNNNQSDTVIQAPVQSNDCEFSDSLYATHQFRAINQARNILARSKSLNINKRYVIVADLSITMAKKRLYLVDVDSQKIVYKSLVAHGSGNNSTRCFAATSNLPGSHCSSLGRYLVQFKDSLWGEFGKGFWMNGIDPENSNAKKRLIVFHYYDKQPAEEGQFPIYFSQGCPMVSEKDFWYFNSFLKKISVPILMYIYK